VPPERLLRQLLNKDEALPSIMQSPYGTAWMVQHLGIDFCVFYTNTPSCDVQVLNG
jgi:hypothetical protein